MWAGSTWFSADMPVRLLYLRELKKAVQRHRSHHGAFSHDTAPSDVPRKGRNFFGTAAGEGDGTVLTAFIATKGKAKQGCDLFFSFNVHRSKSNLQNKAVLFGLLSKYFDVSKWKENNDECVVPKFSSHLLLLETEEPLPAPGQAPSFL